MRPSHLLATVCAAAVLTASASPAPQAPAAASTATGTPTKPVWAHEHSDLTPDPAIRYGRLPNGVRYAIRRNKTPPGEAVIYMRMDAGSLDEREDQLGLAHFMEHMVFNGSRHVPEGEFVRRLERLGLALGADANASTTFDQTVYTFQLPSVSDDAVDTGLLLMREAGGEALLDTASLDRERGVVESEERSTDNPGARMERAQVAFLMKGQLPPKRWPIGSMKIVSTAPRERLLEFYESYYRPENTTLIVVGDVEPDVIERKIRARFGDWRNNRPAGSPPAVGPVARRGLEVQTYHKAGVPSTITIGWNSDPDLSPDTRAKRERYFREQLGLAVLNRRFGRIALRGNPPFSVASASNETSLNAISSTGVSARFTQGQWRPALEAIEQEQRRIVQYGVTQAELDRAIRETREGYRNGVAAASTRSSDALASDILAGVSGDRVVTTPTDRLAVFEGTVRHLTAAQVSADLSRLFQGQGPLIFVASPDPLGADDTAIAQAFQRSRQVAVAPPPQVGAKAWAYTNFGATGRVVERRDVADLGTTFVRFANGVRLTVRPSQSDKNRIAVSVRVGNGQLDLPLDRPMPSWAVRGVLVDGGLRRMTTEQIDDALAGRNYGTGISIDDDAFVLDGTTPPQDFLTQMQVLTAYVSDPGWRPEGLERAKLAALAQNEQLKTSPSGTLASKLRVIVRSGDRRFAQPTPEEIKATTVADVRRALAPITEEPIEVVVAGDVSVDEAIRTTAQTFGALPPRHPASFPPAALHTPFPSATAPIRVEYDGRPDQALVGVVWPTDDVPTNQQKARAVRVLQSVLLLRLIDEIREKQGVTYSPGVQGEASWVYPHFGFIAAAILAKPDRLEPFVTDTFTIAKSLRDTPVTPDELKRAVSPMTAALHRSREGNDYWASALAGAQADPRRLEAIRDAVSGLQRVTPADVQAVAREYLRDDRALRAFAVPLAPAAHGAGD